MTTAFIPLAESFDIIDDDFNANTSDIMDLPEVSESFEGLLDRQPGFSESNRSVPCRLFLKQGCYQIRMERSGILESGKAPRYVGSLRVENNDGTLTISGDFYKPRSWTSSVSGRPGWTELFVEDPFRGRPVIPIYPRNRYYSYLKVIGIRRSLRATLNKPCTITLTVEEYNYTHPEGTEVTGRFPETPSRVLTIVLQKVRNPEGYSGPSFEGSVYEGARLLSYKFSMLWVSDFYRRAKLELESVAGAAIPSSAGAENFRSIYATAGWDLNVVNGDTNLPIPTGVSTTDPWSNAELHEFMLANRNPATDLDKEWQLYYVSVPFDSGFISGIFGIMFDEIADQREGACNFIQNFTGVHNDDRAKLRSAVHEVGHGFNQLHPPFEGLPADNSIMSQTGDVRSIIRASGGTYPDDIRFAFNEHNRHHLIHFPDVVVRPGGEDFEFGHDTDFAPEAMDNADAAGLKLNIRPGSNRLKLGEPLTLRIELLNDGGNTIHVPQNIGTAFHSLELVVSQPGKSAHHFHSFVIACDGQDYIELKPGQKVGADETIFWDRNGFIFQSPGMYLVTATVVWDDAGQPFAVQATADIWVDYPVMDKDNHVAALLLHKEVGKYIALGGNAGHLKEAVARIKRATEVAQNHPAVQRILKINEAGKKQQPEKQLA